MHLKSSLCSYVGTRKEPANGDTSWEGCGRAAGCEAWLEERVGRSRLVCYNVFGVLELREVRLEQREKTITSRSKEECGVL